MRGLVLSLATLLVLVAVSCGNVGRPTAGHDLLAEQYRLQGAIIGVALAGRGSPLVCSRWAQTQKIGINSVPLILRRG